MREWLSIEFWVILIFKWRLEKEIFRKSLGRSGLSSRRVRD